MKTPPRRASALRLYVRWWRGHWRLGEQLALALAGLLATALNLLIPVMAPWGGLALAAGVALAAVLRRGPMAAVGVGVGTVTGLMFAQTPPATLLLSCVAMAAAVAAATQALRWVPFAARLERARDVVWLTVAVVAVAAPTVALVLITAPALGFPGVGHVDPADAPSSIAQVWLWSALGMLLSVTPSLLIDRRAAAGFSRSRLAITLALGVSVPVVAGVACALAAAGEPLIALWLAFLSPVLVALLALWAGSAVASLVLLLTCAGALKFLSSQPSTELLVALGGQVASALSLLLLVHASNKESTSREQRWEWALDGSRLGVADWHLRRAETFVSRAWQALSGIEGTHWTPESWLEQVHPEDRPGLEQAIAQVAAGETGRLRLELRMPSPPGWRWMEATLLVIERGLDGRPSRLLATLSDVEERHDALERQRLSGSLFQHLHEGLLITDADLRVLDANPAYTQILGVPRDELLGSVPSVLRPAPADPLARQQRAAMWSSLRVTGSWRGELLERRRNGEACTLQATISTVQGPNADLRYHVLLISDISEQRAQRERLERQAHFDELTRLPNRVRLSQLLADAMHAADRDGYLLVVCYLDLDRFKPVNDRFGHAAGDRLLSELAGRLRSALRSREHWADSAARLGGDEFVLLLRAGTLEEARLAVERVLRVVSQPYVIDPAEDPVTVTASMGATVYPIDRSDADALLRHADHAMYGAKQSGRNGYLFFDPEHRRRTEERVMAIGRVQEALDQAEFVLFYQPEVDMRSGRVLGFEALLRWEHPQQGLIPPMQFLPLIENTGLSARIGDWVFSQALEHLSQWRRQGLDISVSVNVSARHLQEPDFAQRLSELLARHPEPLAPYMELEILETTAHNDIEATSVLMARCRTLGVRFALDDFGTGYSTLTYLKRLPVDVLKIDRSFIHQMLDDAQDRGIVEGVIGLARTFGCKVVAEGVETPAQARALLEMGCDIGQGTGLAAPMPASQIAGWVRDYKGVFALAPAVPATPARSAALGD